MYTSKVTEMGRGKKKEKMDQKILRLIRLEPFSTIDELDEVIC